MSLLGFAPYTKQRLLTYHESREDAEKRTTKRKQDEEKGLVKKKRNSPDPSKVDFRRDDLIEKASRLFQENEHPEVRIFQILSFDIMQNV